MGLHQFIAITVGESGGVFNTTPAGPRAGSIWLNVEKPILQLNGMKIIRH